MNNYWILTKRAKNLAITILIFRVTAQVRYPITTTMSDFRARNHDSQKNEDRDYSSIRNEWSSDHERNLSHFQEREQLPNYTTFFQYSRLQQMKFTAPDCSILDLKALSLGQIYVREVLKYLWSNSRPYFIAIYFYQCL